MRLQILIIQKKVQAIKYINSKSPLLCTKLITKPRFEVFVLSMGYTSQQHYLKIQPL